MNQVRGNLGIRLRSEFVAFCQHLVLDDLEVFDNAVVNNRDTVSGDMRVCIGVRYTTVGRPSGVRNAELAAER